MVVVRTEWKSTMKLLVASQPLASSLSIKNSVIIILLTITSFYFWVQTIAPAALPNPYPTGTSPSARLLPLVTNFGGGPKWVLSLSWVMFCKLLNFSELQFLICQNENHNTLNHSLTNQWHRRMVGKAIAIDSKILMRQKQQNIM